MCFRPTQALRLHQEHRIARTLDLCTRIPSLRHSPLKELTRLAVHLKESSYSKGQVRAQLLQLSAPLSCVCVLHSASCNPLQCGTNATRTASPAVAAAASQSTPQPEQSCVCWTFAGQTILRQGQEVSDIHFVMHGSVHLTYSAALAQAAARAAARNSSGGGLPPGAARLSSGGWPAAAAAGTDGGPRASSAGRFSGLALALKLEQSCFDPPVVLATRCVACRAQLLGSVPERPRGCWPGWPAT